jgi:hypothetical protein
VFILNRLISRSSRSLAVMIGFARSANGGGREGLRGSPDDPLVSVPYARTIPSRNTSVNPG